jgi:hypothetical protein
MERAGKRLPLDCRTPDFQRSDDTVQRSFVFFRFMLINLFCHPASSKPSSLRDFAAWRLCVKTIRVNLRNLCQKNPCFIRVQSVAKKHFAIRVIEFSGVCGKLCAQ